MSDAPEVVRMSVREIFPSPENDRLYKPVDPTDPAIVELAQSVRDNGQLDPIMVTIDGYIVSGHRRFAACLLAGLAYVNVIIVPIRRKDDLDAFVKLLREHNRQRVKSLDEQIREAVIDADPMEARFELELHRRETSKVGRDPLRMNSTRARKQISAAKQPFIDAIQAVLAGLENFGAVSDRQIHYGLLNNPPLKHASKPDSTYQNDKASYKSLVELLTRMRICGMIRFDAIADETRPVDNWNTYREPGAFFNSQMSRFLKGYYRDLQQSQPNHVEVLVEKNTVAGLIRPICAEYCIAMTSGRGFCSLPPRYDMAQRFERSGKSRLILLAVSDFDPDGEAIAETFARSMRDDFGIESIHPIKVALTAAQVTQYRLPPSMEAKAGSSRTKGFVDEYGLNVWELEALPPATLQQVVRDAIESVLDIELLRNEIAQESRDAAQLLSIRETVTQQLQSFKLYA